MSRHITILLDASSKINAGLKSGNTINTGDFNQCIDIKENIENITLRGKHCMMSLSFTSTSVDYLENLFQDSFHLFGVDVSGIGSTLEVGPEYLAYTMALCVPDGCTMHDVIQLVESQYGSIFNVTSSRDTCTTQESGPVLGVGQWMFICLLGVYLVFLLFITLLDIFIQRSTNDHNKLKTKRCFSTLMCFSAYRNSDHLFSLKKSSGYQCLDGIRAISNMWIVLGHQFSVSYYDAFAGNKYSIFKLRQKLMYEVFLAGRVAVDSFFFMSGLLLMNSYLKSRISNVPFNIPLIYALRLLRIMPPFLMVFLFLINIYEFMGSGPLWSSLNGVEQCRSRWWATVFLLHNYAGSDTQAPSICMTHVWYLAVDMQLFLLSPLILIPIWRWKKYAIHFLCVLISISIIIPFEIAWRYKQAQNGTFAQMFDWSYVRTECRAGAWLVGLTCSCILFNYQNRKITMKPAIVALCWVMSAIAMSFIVLSGYMVEQPGYVYNVVYNASYIGFHRVVWAIALSWIVFSSVNGYGGIVNWFLSLPIFKVLGKLAYSTYLIHLNFQLYLIQTQRYPRYNSIGRTLLDAITAYTICSAIAVFWTLAFEMPFAALCRNLSQKNIKRVNQVPLTSRTDEKHVVEGEENKNYVVKL